MALFNNATLRVGAALVAAAFLGSTSVRGDLPPIVYDYYIATDGSDAADGLSLATAWQSLNKTASVSIVAGQTKSVYIASGTYSKSTDYVILQKDGIAGATINITFANAVVMDGTLANPGATSAINGFEISGTSAWTCNIYGNGLAVNNYHDSGKPSSPNGVGNRGSTTVNCYEVHTNNCDDGFSCHDGASMYLYDCTSTGAEKGCFNHTSTAVVEAHRCTFTGSNGTLGLGGNYSTGVNRLYDCVLVPSVSGEPYQGNNTLFDGCRIGTSALRVAMTASVAATITDSYLNLYMDGNAKGAITRCYGKFSTRVRSGGDISMQRSVIIGPASGKTVVFEGTTSLGASKMAYSNNVFAGTYTLCDINAARAAEIVAAVSEFKNNILYPSLVWDADLVAADSGGTVVVGTLTADPLIGAANTFVQADYAVQAGSPAIGAGTPSGNIGFAYDEI